MNSFQSIQNTIDYSNMYFQRTWLLEDTSDVYKKARQLAAVETRYDKAVNSAEWILRNTRNSAN